MNSEMRSAMRDLVHRLCQSVYREMQLRAEIARLKRELEEVQRAYRRH
jgi:hypothetical protein